MANAWLTPQAAAERAGVAVATIRRAIKRGDLPAFRIAQGRLVRLRVEDLDQWLGATPVKAS
jgi:excisionase family DNA binding protein